MEKSPDAFRTISEAADDLGLPQHVLRFWETRFPQIKPLKRGGGRRYYRPDDVEILRVVKQLLYDEGYTIKGVQRLFKEQGARAVVSTSQSRDAVAAAPEVELAEPAPPDRSQGTEPSMERPIEQPGVTNARGLSAADLQSLRAALAEISEGERILALARAS
jgi:DNA-binding transcriptional MerR regulator